MTSTKSIFTIAALMAALAPQTALAYIGPGVGAGALAAVLGVFGAMFLGLAAIIYYPIKRLIRSRRAVGTGDKKFD